jgi:hypothetical protein
MEAGFQGLPSLKEQAVILMPFGSKNRFSGTANWMQSLKPPPSIRDVLLKGGSK